MPAPYPVPDIDKLIVRYQSGESPTELGNEFGVGRGAVMWWLRRAGVPLRNKSSAALVRDYRISPEKRKARAAAAHAARRGAKNTFHSGIQRALTVEKKGVAGSRYELEMAFWLAQRGRLPVLQKAIGIYNVDIAIEESRVAVEINGPAHFGWGKDRRGPERTEEILGAGWNLIEVTIYPYCHRLRTAAADEVIAFAKEARSNESARGHHRVISGNGQTLTGSSD